MPSGVTRPLTPRVVQCEANDRDGKSYPERSSSRLELGGWLI